MRLQPCDVFRGQLRAGHRPPTVIVEVAGLISAPSGAGVSTTTSGTSLGATAPRRPAGRWRTELGARYDMGTHR